jgi:hypothetical protein
MMGIGKYSIVNYEPKHFMHFSDDSASAELNHTTGSAFTALYHGTPIGCAGLRPMWGGVAEAWILFGPDAKDHILYLYKNTKQYLSDLTDKLNLHRIQAYCRTDWPEAINFLHHAGFVVEGKARGYNVDGTDAYFMAIVNG